MAQNGLLSDPTRTEMADVSERFIASVFRQWTGMCSNVLGVGSYAVLDLVRMKRRFFEEQRDVDAVVEEIHNRVKAVFGEV